MKGEMFIVQKRGPEVHGVAIGDTVIYCAFGGARRLVRVVGFGEKNGQPLFDGVLLEPAVGLEVGECVWGYFSQIQSVDHKEG